MRIYIVPSSLLVQAAKFLCTDVEKLCFVTGVRLLNSIIVLTHLVFVEFTGSRGGASPKPGSLFKEHNKLQELGQDIEAQWHSHPGWELGCTWPSITDLSTARRWESDGPFIGAIFSEGGRYVRFFNHHQKSVVVVQGNIKELSPGVYELPVEGELAVQPTTGELGGLQPERPSGEIVLVEAGSHPQEQGADSRSGWPWVERRSRVRADGNRTSGLR